MAMVPRIQRYASRRLTRRLYRAVPWLGGVLALATLGKAIQRKGIIGGTAHTALDFIPYLGGAKVLLEAHRGRDFIRDRPPAF